MDKKSRLGYRFDSPYKTAPYLDIFTEHGMIDMSATDQDLLGIDEFGNHQVMRAGDTNPYKFEGNKVREIPMGTGGTVNKLFKYLFDDEEEAAPAPTESNADELIGQNESLIQENEILKRRYEKELQDQEDLNSAMAIFNDIDFEDEQPQTQEGWPGISGMMGRSTVPSAMVPASHLTPDSYLKAIFGNEAGKTGVDPKNVKGEASGRFGIIPKGRKDVYNKHFKGQMSYEQFEKQYNSDAGFEYQVASKLAEDKIKSSKSVAEAIGSWYSPAHAKAGQWGVIPRPDYGNTKTVGQYVNNALKNLR